MKKLFSIALVIAMAISCLAIVPSAVDNVYSADSDLRIEAEFINNNTQLAVSLVLDLGVETVDTVALDKGAMDLYFLYNESEIKPLDISTATFTATGADDYLEPLYADEGIVEGAIYFRTAGLAVPYRNQFTATYYFDVLAAPGETITITDDGCRIRYNSDFWCTTPEITVTVPAATPTYEAPASAKAQELAGCEACGVEAGVRFIAEVDAAATEYGMYITANGKTYTLTSADADFIRKVETEETVTFTAVIFSDLTFEVVVFEKYGDTEVKSDAVRN